MIMYLDLIFNWGITIKEVLIGGLSLPYLY